jgi:predicted nucleic acid-binding protein
LKYLVDTNVLSELQKLRPEPNAQAWFKSVPPNDVHVSVITLGEIEKGIEKVRAADPEYASALDRWLQTVLDNYADRIIDVDVSIARRWGVLGHSHGHAPVDAMLAATAIERGLVLVTRNVRDIERTGVRWLNPFVRPFRVR